MLSVPIFSFVWFYNRAFFYNSLHGMLFSSFLIDLSYHPLVNFGDSFHQNPMISSMVGGILIGSGIGLMLRVKTSIGGTDLLGQIVASHVNINPGIVIFLIDIIIICIGTTFIEGSSLFHSLITVICVGIMTSLISAREIRIINFSPP